MAKHPRQLIYLEQIIADAANIDMEDISGRSRVKEIVQARHAVWYVAHEYMGYSLSHLSRIYGRDRTTIQYAVDKIYSMDDAKKHIEEGVRKANPLILKRSQKYGERDIQDWVF